MVKFQDKGHKYWSDDDTKWISVSTLVHSLSNPFGDRHEIARKCAIKKPTAKKPNKWYGMPTQEILQAWDSENLRSTELGTWYHKQREDALYAPEFKAINRVHIPDIRGEVKYAQSQILEEGIYPEFLCYLPSAGVCGQSDKVIVRDAILNVEDYKTNKEIERTSHVDWEGHSKMMLGPVSHLEDCNYNHYALQLSTYMYILHRHNPNLQVGNLTIEHITFVKEGEDKYGYPLYKQDEQGGYIVDHIEYIQLPYMKKEVIAMLTWLKDNKNKIHK